jgi:hypothetical protein
MGTNYSVQGSDEVFLSKARATYGQRFMSVA